MSVESLEVGERGWCVSDRGPKEVKAVGCGGGGWGRNWRLSSMRGGKSRGGA